MKQNRKYYSGSRSIECVRLIVKDTQFKMNEIIVCNGKGKKVIEIAKRAFYLLRRAFVFGTGLQLLKTFLAQNSRL